MEIKRILDCSPCEALILDLQEPNTKSSSPLVFVLQGVVKSVVIQYFCDHGQANALTVGFGGVEWGE